ncbi:1934_t:CDS:2 [Paraglomus occultum]|uniref:1934_t:CDS:1 n=1 Tax=Paraglomus occultum TaxID=144539 RepID=A0A9N9BSE3_9GLOM|nr:1934_t:CDS:2 [Paraglomus occultum]
MTWWTIRDTDTRRGSMSHRTEHDGEQVKLQGALNGHRSLEGDQIRINFSGIDPKKEAMKGFPNYVAKRLTHPDIW